MTRKAYLAFLFPSIFLVGTVCLVPLASVLYLSLTGKDGFTLSHYASVLLSASNRRVIFDTLYVSFVVTLISGVLGYLVAYFVYSATPRWQPLLFALILLPFWTSSLVRTYSWVVLLQRKGVINQGLIAAGIINEPLNLVFNFPGAIIGMTHVTLPLFVLPLYGAMKALDRNFLRAATSLGATGLQVFWGVFFPLTLPAALAGAVIVFIYSLGFFATPQILGGGNVILISEKIQQSVTTYPDWGVAASMGITLLVMTLALLALVSQIRRSQIFFRSFR
jgi:putative spermidine/putrescine transport system permease protein/spermidine/putrescine transport system permease protein